MGKKGLMCLRSFLAEASICYRDYLKVETTDAVGEIYSKGHLKKDGWYIEKVYISESR